ncbi:MAG: hypothetical protein ACREHF_02180 [Rhizomicrobium sp.]
MTSTPLQDIQQLQTNSGILDLWLTADAETDVDFSAAQDGSSMRPSLAKFLAGIGSATLVVKSANFAAAGSEGFIECDAAGGPFTITVLPSAVDGRAPLRIRKIDTSANAVSISDGTNVVFALASAANADGNLGGWCDVSSNGINLRTEGVP